MPLVLKNVNPPQSSAPAAGGPTPDARRAGGFKQARIDPPEPLMTTDTIVGTVIRCNRHGYSILEKLGQGGMASVYRGEDIERPGRSVAVKIIKMDESEMARILDGFVREVLATAQIIHPNVVRVLDAGVYRNSPVYVMELLRGTDLRRVMTKKAEEGKTEDGRSRFIWGELRDVALDVCKALEAAHARGVMHRDISPDNVFLAMGRDGQRTVKVLDFGIAQLMGGSRVAGAELESGKQQYVAPEQLVASFFTSHTSPDQADASIRDIIKQIFVEQTLDGKYKLKSYDHRVDQYQLAAMLYYLLTGRFPFHNLPDKQRLIVLPTPPAEIAPEIPAPVSKAIMRAMAINPVDRFKNIIEMRVALERCKVKPRGVTDPFFGLRDSVTDLGADLSASSSSGSMGSTTTQVAEFTGLGGAPGHAVSRSKKFWVSVASWALTLTTVACAGLGVYSYRDPIRIGGQQIIQRLIGAPSAQSDGSEVSSQGGAARTAPEPEKSYSISVQSDPAQAKVFQLYHTGQDGTKIYPPGMVELGITPFIGEMRGTVGLFIAKDGYSPIQVEVSPDRPESMVQKIHLRKMITPRRHR